MGLMEAMTGYRKKDPYQEALVQLDKTNPGFAKFLREKNRSRAREEREGRHRRQEKDDFG